MKRVLQSIGGFLLSVLLLSVLTFVLSRLSPGDPLVAYYGDAVDRMSTAEQELARARLGLDESLVSQYFKWLGCALQGDFGISYQYKQSALAVVGSRLLNTVLLGGLGFVLTFLLSLWLGIRCAVTKRRWLDRLCQQIGTAISCIPTFWLSLLLILIFGVWLAVLPISGAYAVGMSGSVLSRLTHLILPLATLVLSHLWYYASVIRGKFLQELSQDYVALARAKGLSERTVIYKHCLPNVLPSYLSLMATGIGHIIAGSYLVEMVFSYPGLGTLAFESAKYHDYNLLMLVTLLTGSATMLFCQFGNWLGGRLDPRTKGGVD